MGKFKYRLTLARVGGLYKTMVFDPIENYRKLARFISEIRQFFLNQQFLETPTPTLVLCPGMEAHLDPISVEGEGYLPTSPEIHLKRLLCRGFERIFEIRPCFRNDPKTGRHLKEFLMLEWYRTQSQLVDLISDIQGLLSHLQEKGLWPHDIQIQHKTFASLFQEHFRFSFTAKTTQMELRSLLKEQGLHFTPEDSKEDLIHRLLLEKFEPSFQGLTLLSDFPPEMAILSQIGANGFAERFELFYGDMELANAFHEVTDPKVQEERWKRDVEERRILGLKTLSPDLRLIEDMKNYGMPPSSGIALGIDRLFMISQNISEIEELRPF